MADQIASLQCFGLFQVTALSKDVAALEAQVERITREKNSLVNQLEESQCQLASHEMEMNKVSTFIKKF